MARPKNGRYGGKQMTPEEKQRIAISSGAQRQAEATRRAAQQYVQGIQDVSEQMRRDMDQIRQTLRSELQDPTVAIKNASRSSTILGWGLIIAGSAGWVVIVIELVKWLRS